MAQNWLAKNWWNCGAVQKRGVCDPILNDFSYLATEIQLSLVRTGSTPFTIELDTFFDGQTRQFNLY